MLRPTIVLALASSLVGLAMAAAAPTSPDWYSSVEEARDAARSSDRQILVDLYADWCLWCGELEERVFSQASFRETVGARYVFLRVDVEESEGAELQGRFRVGSLPTTLLMTADRVEIGRIEGFLPLDRFQDEIASREESWRAFQARYEKEAGSDHRDTLIRLATDLYDRGDGRRAAGVYRRLLPRTAPGSEERARLTYQIAEAWRRGGDLERAEATYQEALSAIQTADLEGSDLSARIALLRFEIDRDRGECRSAVTSLERFLESYPENEMARPARNALQRLKHSESCA